MWELHNLALNQVGAHLGNGPWDADLHSIEENYLEAGGEFLIGLCGSKVVAMGALHRVSDHHAEVKRMRVHPHCQRRGLGDAILRQLEACALSRGYHRLTLDTTVQQVAAQQLYAKHGYRETGRTKVGPFDVILYEKQL